MPLTNTGGVQIGIDVTEVDNELAKFQTEIEKTTKGLNDFTQSVVTFNTAGKTFTSTVTQIDASGRKLNTTFGETANGAKLLSQKITASADDIKFKIQDMQRAVGQGAADRARSLFPVPDGSSASQIIRYTKLIDDFQRTVGKTADSVGAANLNFIFRQAERGPAALTAALGQLTPQARAVALSLLNVGAAVQTIGEKSSIIDRLGISVQNLARVGLVQAFRRVETALINNLISGTREAVAFQVSLQQVGNTTNQIGPNLTNLQSIVRGFSEQFGQSSADVLQAAGPAFRSQFNDAAQGSEVLRSALTLSNATGLDLSKTTELLTGALAGFNKKGDEAASVANTLYLASLQSRSGIEQFTVSMGRVSEAAKELGLPFERVLAIFLQIEKNGGRPTEALSVLRQVMSRLNNPTQELAQVIRNEFGTATAQAAVESLGLYQVLNRLNQVNTETPGKLGDVAGSLKNLTSFMDLTANSAAQLDNIFRDLSRGDPFAALNASQRVDDTPAKEFEKQFQRIKNQFTQDFGASVLSTLKSITDAFGGLNQTVIITFESLRTALTIFLGFKTVVLIPGALVAGFKAVRDAIILAQLQFEAFSLRMNALSSLSVFGIGAGIGVGLFVLFDQLVRGVDRANEAIERLRIKDELAKIEDQARRTGLAIASASQQQINNYNQEVSAAFQPRLRILGQIITAQERLRQLQLNQHTETIATFRVQNQEFLDGIRRRLQEASSAAKQSEADSKTALRNVSTFAEQSANRNFQLQLHNEQNPFAAIQIINQRRQQILQELDAAFKSGDRLRLQAARLQAQELLRLNQEETQQEFSIQQQLFQQGRIQGTVINDILGTRTVLQLNLTGSRQREAQATQLMTQLEKDLAFSEHERQKNKENEAQKIRNIEREMESLLRAAEQFRIFNQQGQLLPTFKSPQDALNQASALFDRIRERAKALGLDVSAIDPLLNQINANLQGEVRGTEAVEAARRRSLEVLQLQAAQQDAIAARQRDIKAEQDRINDSARALGSIFARTRITQLSNFDFASAAPPTTNTDSWAQTFRELLPTVQELIPAFQALRSAQEALGSTGGQTQANIDRFTEANRRFETIAESLRTSDSRLGAFGSAAALIRSVRDFGGNRDVGSGLIGTIQGSRIEIDRMQAIIDSLRQSSARLGADGLDPLTQAMAGLNTNTQNALTPINNLIGAFSLGQPIVSNLAQELERVNGAIIQLQASNFQALLGGQGQAQGNHRGGLVYAFGGGIYGFHPGSPKGTDTIPAWLSPGEYVMDSANTRRNFTTLIAMSKGQSPVQHLAGGGPVSVGDINVTVQGGDSSEKTIREIGRGIDREIRRGTIRFKSSSK